MEILLSPYLFILCLERLYILLEEAIQDRAIHPVTFRSQIKISHLFFAHDIFLSSKVKITECHNLKNILQKFYQCSSQIICTQKSRLWFSPNMPKRTKELIASIFDIPTRTQLGNYFGTPIFTTRRQTLAYQYLVDKIQKKIGGWQAKYFSVVGRVTSASILIHAMQTTLLPQKIIRQLDKLNCKFLWGDIANHRHCHMVCWETITTPKDAGGLGL